jgi:hypothetical protein
MALEDEIVLAMKFDRKTEAAEYVCRGCATPAQIKKHDRTFWFALFALSSNKKIRRNACFLGSSEKKRTKKQKAKATPADAEAPKRRFDPDPERTLFRYSAAQSPSPRREGREGWEGCVIGNLEPTLRYHKCAGILSRYDDDVVRRLNCDVVRRHRCRRHVAVMSQRRR